MPPLSLLFLESFLASHGFKTKIIDLSIIFYNLLKLPKKEWLSLNSGFENNILNKIKKEFPGLIDELIYKISNSRARILGFSLYGRNRRSTKDFIDEITKTDKSRVIVIGGPEILFEYHRNSFFSDFDDSNAYFVLGEGEQPLLDICNHVYNNKSLRIQSHKDKKTILYNEVAHLDNLPFANFDNLNLEYYNLNTIPLFSSRGCIRKCKFCSEYKLYKKYRQHSPEYMLKFIEYALDKYKAVNFSFHDSVLNADLLWLDRFCSLIIKNKMKIKWEAQFIVRNDMPMELLRKIKSSGCYNLFIGLESGSDRILKLMNKGYNSKIASDFFKKLFLSGLQYEISLIAGFPYESDKDFNDNIEFIRRNKQHIPKIAQVNPFVEYPPSSINKNYAEAKVVANRVNRIIEMLKQERIKYTHSFINNLIER